jgi:hypothetical protein
MPSSAVRTFHRPHEYFAEIRNLQVGGLVERRGEFCAEATRIGLQRLWTHRFVEHLSRIIGPPSAPVGYSQIGDDAFRHGSPRLGAAAEGKSPERRT